jgi:hypothetical protein
MDRLGASRRRPGHSIHRMGSIPKDKPDEPFSTSSRTNRLGWNLECLALSSEFYSNGEYRRERSRLLPQYPRWLSA